MSFSLKRINFIKDNSNSKGKASKNNLKIGVVFVGFAIRKKSRINKLKCLMDNSSINI